MTVKLYDTVSEGRQIPWVETPLRESYALSQAAGCVMKSHDEGILNRRSRIFLKLENLQPSGSFKSRGVGNYIVRRLEELPDGSRPHIFISSGGNAGLAAVHAARSFELHCTVVVPLSTSALMVAKLKESGAYDVVQYGNIWKDADTYLQEHLLPACKSPSIYCPPFDHPDIWTGNATLMHEIATQMPGGSAPDALVCSVGGGGLFNGVCQAIDDLSLHSTTVIAVETKGADSLNASLLARELVTLPTITSAATSLGCARVTPVTFKYGQRSNVRSVVLSDAEAAMGCWKFADGERIMVELACGVNVALCYGKRLEKALGRKVRLEDNVVIVLCGGSNVTSEMLCGWRREFGDLDGDVCGRDQCDFARDINEVCN